MACVQGNIMSKFNSRQAPVRSIWDYFGAGEGVIGGKG